MAARINLIPNPNYRKSGTKSYLHMMRKYNFHPTKEGPYFLGSVVQQTGRVFTEERIGGRAFPRQIMQKTLADGSVGEVQADDVQNDAMYLAPVSIGTPGQTLKLDFDSGSADLWVWSTDLPSNVLAGRKGHTVFDPSKSSTFQTEPSSSWQIRYGDGSSASGVVGTDTIDVGGVKVQNQAVELANHLSAQFLQTTGDGLLGLAFPKINTVKPSPAHTPVENMIEQGDISAKLFTVRLTSYRDANEEPFYTFGFIDEPTVKATGQEIHYAPVDKHIGMWMFSSSTASVNGQTISRPQNNAIADTGTTLALVDDQTVEAIYKAIPGAVYDPSQQGYVFPADTPVDKLPTVGFAVGDKPFMVPKEDLAFAPAKPGYVFGGIQSRGKLQFDILGDTFLKAIYAVFDVGNLRFGAVQR